MFKFNFPNGDQEDTAEIPTSDVNNESKSSIHEAQGQEIEVTSQHRESIQQYRENGSSTSMVRDFYLVDLKHVEELVQQSGKFESLNSALQMNSDLLTGVYEGKWMN